VACMRVNMIAIRRSYPLRPGPNTPVIRCPMCAGYGLVGKPAGQYRRYGPRGGITRRYRGISVVGSGERHFRYQMLDAEQFQ
jgi:hypothetical protein